MADNLKGFASPETREAARAGATSLNHVVVYSTYTPENTRRAPSGQGVGDLLRSARTCLMRGLRSEGADAFAAFSLGRHHARQADRLAILTEVRP